MHGKFNKCTGILLAALALIVVGLPAVASEGQDSEDRAAVVNGVVITQSELDMETRRMERILQKLNRLPESSQLQELRSQALRNLINRELLYQESQKQDIHVDEAEVDQQMKVLAERFSSEQEFADALRSMNLSRDLVRSQLEKDIAIRQLIDEEISSKITVSDEETRAYYDGHPDLFKEPEKVRARHILIRVDPQAEDSEKAEAQAKLKEVQQRLEAGEDFSTLAKEYSQGPSSARGGDLGYFRRGQMLEPFEEAAFALKPGEVSKVVETRFGYHLIKMLDKKPETTLSYEEVKDRLKERLQQQKRQQQIVGYLEKLEQEAEVERFIPRSGE